MKIFFCIDCQEVDIISIDNSDTSEFEWIDLSNKNFKVSGIRALLEKQLDDLFRLSCDQILI